MHPTNEAYRAGLVLRPAPDENACVMKGDMTTDAHMRSPVRPVTRNPFERVVSVYEQEVNRIGPATGRVNAELAQPPDNAIVNRPNGATRNDQREAHEQPARLVWIDQIEGALRGHDLTQLFRRAPFGDAEFHERHRASCVLAEQLTLFLRVLRGWVPEPQGPKEVPRSVTVRWTVVDSDGHADRRGTLFGGAGAAGGDGAERTGCSIMRMVDKPRRYRIGSTSLTLGDLRLLGRQDPRAEPLALPGLLIHGPVVDPGARNRTVRDPTISPRSRARPLRTTGRRPPQPRR